MTNEIKAVIFDWGNVIAQFTNENFIQYLVPYTDKTPEELTKLIYPAKMPLGNTPGLITSGLPEQYELGSITSNEFYQGIRELTGADISKETFSEIYVQDKFWPISSTIGIMRKLKRSGRTVGLLSNTSEWDYELGFKPVFRRARIEPDFESLAFEVGVLKPSPEIYLDALGKLQRLEISAEQCVYIDDVKKYAEAAKKFGMVGIHYTHGKDNLETQLIDAGALI